MFRTSKQLRRWTTIAVAIGLVCTSATPAAKPVKPPPGPTPAQLNPAIAYVQVQKDGTVDVLVAAADLGSQVVLTASVRNTQQGIHRQFGSPAWSADGQFVAFWGQDKGADGNPLHVMLFVARADGTQVRLVRDFNTRPGPDPAFSDGLNWSPSGKELVYSPNDNDPKIIAIDVLSGDTKYLLDGDLFEPVGHPALSPDLEALPGYQGFLAARGPDGSLEPDGAWCWDIFIVPIDDDAEGYLLPVDPTLFLNVTNKPGSSQFHPSWSPDGTKLACFDDESLAVIDLASGQWQTLAPNYATGVSGQDRATWTSNASALVFQSRDIPLHDLAIISADGTSPAVNYTATKNLVEKAPAWNPQWDPEGPGGF